MIPAAALEGVSKRYGAVPALEGVTLELRGGECLALVGHNGSGKSTLIRTLLGLVRPDAGRVRVLGGPPAAARGAVGYLPEAVAFDPAMTGRQVMRFYSRLGGLGRDAGEALLAEVGLAQDAGRRVGGYSKGMHQRLGLAQALLGTPRLLLLDEPTGGLDPLFRRRFYDLVAARRAAGAAVLISSHALDEAGTWADRVAILARGRLAAHGTPAEIGRAAEVPARFRITIAPCHSAEVIARLPEGVRACPLGPDRMLVSCQWQEKLAVLRTLADFGETVRDIETLRPSLDDLCARMLGKGEA